MATLEDRIKLIGLIVTAGGLALGVVNYLGTVRRDAETRRLEARRPFLADQLTLYREATKVAAQISNGDENSTEGQQVLERFWQLYWGELALVENKAVETAMIHMGDCINGSCPRECTTLRQCSLQVAHACRQSLSESWGVPDWAYAAESAP